MINITVLRESGYFQVEHTNSILGQPDNQQKMPSTHNPNRARKKYIFNPQSRPSLTNYYSLTMKPTLNSKYFNPT